MGWAPNFPRAGIWGSPRGEQILLHDIPKFRSVYLVEGCLFIPDRNQNGTVIKYLIHPAALK